MVRSLSILLARASIIRVSATQHISDSNNSFITLDPLPMLFPKIIPKLGLVFIVDKMLENVVKIWCVYEVEP